MADRAFKHDRHYTYGDYRSWPDDERWELIDGVAWKMSAAPASEHQRLSWALAGQIRAALKGSECLGFAAPFDVFPLVGPGDSSEEAIDDADTVVQPDLVVVCDRAKLVERGCIGPPDLVIEIVSPSSMSKDLSVKPGLYERAGVKEYWVVVPAYETILVFTLGDDGKYPVEPAVHEQQGTLHSAAISVVEIDLADLFERARV